MSNVSTRSTRSETERKAVARRESMDKKVNDALANGYVAPIFARIDPNKHQNLVAHEIDNSFEAKGRFG